MDILSHLSNTHPWRETIHIFDTIDSTNTQAKLLASQGAPHGTVLIARQQTGGRGRMGRSFFSPRDAGLYLSVILRPQCAPKDLMHLTCAVAVAACDAVEAATGFRPGIKWINDLTWGSRKLGGILTELSVTPGSDTVDYAVIGIGINCDKTAYPQELADIALSLQEITGKAVSPSLVAARLLECLAEMDRHLLSDKEEILSSYQADCVTLGKQVAVHSPNGLYEATAMDIDSEGALVVKDREGNVYSVSSGEVSVRGMYGYI